MKRLFFRVVFTSTLFAQTKTEGVVRRVAARILQTTPFLSVNNMMGEKFASTKGKF